MASVTGLRDRVREPGVAPANEYVAAENRILRAKLASRFRLTNPERATLAEIAKRLGRKALREVATVATPDTILGWYRKLVAEKFDSSRNRTYPGRPRVAPEVEALVVRMAKENSGWGYDRIFGTMANSAMRFRTRRLGTSYADTASLRRLSGVRSRPGKVSSRRT